METQRLMKIAEEKFKDVSFTESNKKMKHGKCIKLIPCLKSPYVVFKFEYGNEFILRQTVNGW